MKLKASLLLKASLFTFLSFFIANQISAQCTVNAGNDTTVCQYLPFTRIASTAIANPQYQWTLQGNSSNILSTSATISITSTTTGNSSYVVSVTGDNNGTPCTITDVFTVNVNPAPSIDAGSDKTVCQGSSLSLSASSNPGNPSITWYLQGGTTALGTGATFNVPTTTAGTFYYVAQATNSSGCSGYDTVKVIINPKPTANFTFTSNCGRKLSFTDASTTASGTLTSWQWDFGGNGNGNSSNQQNPTHKFNQNNQTYNVSLTVTNSFGCTSDTVKPVTTGNGPLPSLISDSSVSVLDDTLYFYSCYSSGGNFPFYNNSQNANLNTTYIIRWGDNSTSNYNQTTFPAQGSTPIIHSYPITGTYSVTFIQNNNDGCIDSVIYKVFFGSVPAGSLGSNLTTTICTGSTQSVIISNTASNTNGTIYSLVFNDGTDTIKLTHPISDPYLVNHLFSTSSCGTNSSNGSSTLANSYGAYLTVKNPCGTRPLAVLGIYVASTPNADFTITPRDTICVSQQVILTNTGDPGSDVNSATGVCVPGKIVWQINPSTPSTLFQVTSGFLGTVYTANPTYWTPGSNVVNVRFDSSGIFTVREIAANTASCAGKDTAIKTICVNPKPTAFFTLNKDSGCAPLVVVATSATNLATCGINTYLWSVSYLPLNGCNPAASDWSFINNTSATSQNPQFQFINPGYYIIKLITIAPNGACQSTPFIDTVKVKGKPIINISALSSICAGQTITPSATATCEYITRYSWTFQNGSPSTSSQASPGPITFNTAGNQTISLTVRNQCDSPTVTRTFQVLPLPSVSFVRDTLLCNGASLPSIVFGGSSVTGTVYNWTVSTNIGLSPLSGTGNLPAFTTVNNGTLPVTATVTITPVANSCQGAPKSFSITVNPSPTITQPGNQTVCNGASTTAVTFGGSSVANTSYSWSISTNIGLTPLLGTGNLPVFTAANTTSVPITATVTVTPTAGGCSGTSKTFTITVNPTPTVDQTNNQTVCNGNLTTPINFIGNSVSGVTYNWTNNQNTIGIASFGSGNIGAFTAVNNGTSPVIATITVTPVASGCQGLSKSFSITVNPAPVVNFSIANQTICSGGTTQAVNLSSTTSNVSFSWSAPQPAGILGLTTSGTTATIPAQTLINSTNATITINFNATASTSGGVACAGSQFTYSITVLPKPNVTAANQTICSGTSSNVTLNTTTSPASAVSYSWTPSVNSNISGAYSSNGNIISQTLSNSAATPQVIVYTITPTYTSGQLTCTGNNSNVTITVNPVPSVNQPGNIYACNNSTVGNITFTSGVSGTTFTWSSGAPSVGINPSSGSGNIPSFTAVNTTNAPISSVITVTPGFANSSGPACSGSSKNFTITVNPTPNINSVPNVTLCANSSSSAVNFSGNVSNTTYTWTNSNPLIGLPSNDSISLPIFTALNSGSIPITATITVTPSYTNALSATPVCTGQAINFTITVNPTPIITVDPARDTICSGTSTNLLISSSISGSGMSYGWTPSSNINITGASASSGSVISQTLTNTTTTAQELTYTINPTYTNNGVACSGNPISAIVQVDPAPNVDQITNNTYCNNATVPSISFSGVIAGTVFSWSAGNPSIGINPSSGTGSISSFAAINNTNAPITSTIAVIPTVSGSSSCTGSNMLFTITVNPTPTVVATPTSRVICSGESSSINLSSNISGSGISYNYAPSSNTLVSGASISSGSTINQLLTNLSTSPQTVNYTVTPIYSNNGVVCNGDDINVPIIINPIPSVNQPNSLVLCQGSSTGLISFSGIVTGTIYRWSNDNTSIGLAAGGVGDISSFIVNNTTNAPITANITVRPLFLNAAGGDTCRGQLKTFTITVNPLPIASLPSNITVCNGSATGNLNFTSPVTGTVFNWVSNPSIGGGIQGTGNIGSFNAINTGTSPITATITVTPSFTNSGLNCTGPDASFQITVNPTPALTFNPTGPQIICSGQSTIAIALSSATQGVNVTYNWTSNLPLGLTGIPASGTGSPISSYTINNNTNIPQTVTFSVSASTSGSANCSSGSSTYDIIVNPKPVIPDQSFTICTGGSINFSPVNNQPTNSTIVPAGTTYTWTVSSNNNISGQNNQAAPQASFSQTLTNLSNAVQSITYTVNPVSGVSGNCVGIPFLIIVNVDPRPKITDQVLAICSGVTFTANIPANTPPTVILPSGTTYTWTVIDNPSVSGESNQANAQATISQTLINNSDQPQTVIYTITPRTGNCPGLEFTLIVTINPAPYIPDATAVTCSGIPFSFSPVNSLPSTIVPAGTTFIWTVANNTNVSGASNQSIPQSTISQTLINNSNTNQTVLYTVTPVSGAPWNCQGPSFTLTVTLNTKPVIPSQTVNVCSGNPFNVSISNTPPAIILPSGTTYTWTVVNNPDVTGESDETVPQPSISQTLINLTNSPQTIVYTVTPSIGNCAGNSFTVTVNVNPSPLVQPQVEAICSGNSFSVSPVNNPPDYIIPTGTTYTWTVSTNNSVTGQSNQTSGQTGISQTLTNLSNSVQNIIYSVTPFYAGCPGAVFPINVTVNPVPLIPGQNISLCSGNTFTFNPINNPPNIIVPSNTSYEWTITNNSNITGQSASAAPQSQISQILVNNTNQPQQLTYTIIPTSGAQGNCLGNPIIINITVNPAPRFQDLYDTICSQSSFIVTPPNTPPLIVPAGTLYSWPVPSMPAGTSGGVPAANSLNINGTLFNNTITPLNVTYLVSPVADPSSGGCSGSDFNFILTILPLDSISNPRSQEVCNGGVSQPVDWTSFIGDSSFTWTLISAGNSLSGYVPSNSGFQLPAVTLSNTGFERDSVVYAVTTSNSWTASRNCPGPIINYTIYVNPDADAGFTFIKDTACWPFVLLITDTSHPTANQDYLWYVDTALLGTGYNFPGHSILNSDERDSITLVSISAYGCKNDTASHVFYTRNKPEPDFAISFDPLACSPLIVGFTNLTETHTTTLISPFNYQWDFGNGNTSNSASPGSQIYYGSTRFVDTMYYVTLTVSNECITLVKKDSILVKSPPNALFAPDRSTVCSNDTAIFFNSSMGLNNTYYWNFGDNSPVRNVSTEDSIQHIYNIGNSNTVFDVRLIAINQCGADTVNNPITITPSGIALNYSITNTTNYVCQQDTVRFYNASSGGTRFTWDFGDGSPLYISNINVENIYHIYANPGRYIITVKGENNCTDTLVIDSVIVIRTPKPDFDIVNNNACPGSSVQFSNQTPAADNYQWDFGDPSSGAANSSTQLSPTHVYANPGVYQVTLTASLLDVSSVVCTKDTSFQVNVIAPIAEINAPDSACVGQTVLFTPQVTIMPGLAPLQDNVWLINGVPVAAPAQYAPDFGHVFSLPGTYTVSLVSSTITGCSDTATSTIVISPLPSLVMGPDQRICLGQSISITAQSNSGNYEWTPAAGLSDTRIQSPVASPQITTRYTVTTYNVFGCSRTGSLLVTVIQPFVLDVSSNDTICIGQSVQLQANGAITYNWAPPTGLSCTACPNPIATPTTTTTYTVTGYGDNNCLPSSETVTVAVGQYPVITMPPSQTLPTGEEYHIIPGYQNGPFSSYLWTPSNDLSCADCADPTAIIRKDLCYSLIATNIYGCADTGQICFVAFCKDFQVKIPNAFMPTDGNPDNNHFTVYGKGIGLVKRMTVFNRWGDVVFENYNFPVNNPSSGWDGRVRGKDPSPDVYVYIVEVICDNGVPFFYKGNVTILK